jgi:hypothetical protein
VRSKGFNYQAGFVSAAWESYRAALEGWHSMRMVVRSFKTLPPPISQHRNLFLDLEGEGMIDFNNWFANIVFSSELIASPDALRKAWVQGDKTITSAHDFSELAEQVLGDLDLEEQIKCFSNELEKRNALAAFSAFSRAFQNVEQSAEENPTLRDPSALLGSEGWLSLRDAARTIIDLASAAPYRGKFSLST